MASSPDCTPSALLSLLLLCFCFYHVAGEEQNFYVLRVDTLLPGSVCSSPKASGPANSLRVTHRRGPCSPYGGSKHRPAWTLRQDLLRVQSLQRRLSTAAPPKGDELLQASQVTLPTSRGTPLGTGNYIVTLGFGTPKKDQIVTFDTGSNVCWIQCAPCAGSCHQQQDPVFDPSASSTYRNISCDTDACRSLDVRGCATGTCLYGVQYGDKSTTVGFLAQETLTLSSDSVIQNFVFGCGQDNQGLYGRTAGLMGFGRSSFSLVKQASQTLGDVFSYCLPTTSSSPGHLTVGKSALNASYTPMLTNARETSLYFVGLSGISVGGQQLPISQTVFRSVGTIIDSGTVITRLPPSAYSALRSAFRSAMSKYTMAPELSLLDTCYDFSNAQTITFPVIRLQFDGGLSLPLQAPGTFFVASVSQVCLAFAANDSPGDVGIVGNVQQRTMEVIYDIGGQRIGFATGACS